jgi:type I restriction enzyme S subunit
MKNKKGWELVKLGELAEIQTGKHDVNHSDENGIYPFYTCALLPFKSNTYSFDDEVLILPGNGANVGEVMYFNGKFEAYQRTYVIHKIKANVKYLYYFMLFKWKSSQSNQQYGSATNYIRLNNITDLQIPLPPLPEQQRIATLLDAADALRRKDRALLQKYEELAQAVFMDMFGDPVKNEKGWEVKTLIDVALSRDDVKCGPFGTQLNKGEFQKTGIPIWGIPQINSNFIKAPTEYLTEKKALELKEYSVQKDDIVMSRKGNVGACSLFPKQLNFGVLHSDAIRIRVNKNIILPEVLLWQFKKSRVLQTQVANVSSGAIMAGINVTNLKQVSVYVPNINVQNKFASELELVENLKEKQLVSILNSNALFQTLLQKAFKGELV